MHRKNSFTALVLTATLGVTVFGAPSWAYMAEKDKLDKAAADIQAGKYKEGANEFKTLADGGCPFAQCIMGDMYLNGRGVPKNIHQAINYFMKSAKQGYPGAEEHLGEIYQFGEEGIRKDPKLAANWYRRAAYHGNSKAQLALGKMFMSSTTKQDALEGKVWLAQAAKIPGAISDEAHKLFMSLPGVSDAAAEITKTQNDFAFGMANLSVGGTLTRGLEEPGTPASKPLEMKPPVDMPGALEEDWDKIASVEKSLAADVTGKADAGDKTDASSN